MPIQSNILYIVPEQFSFEAECELIEIIGENGIIGTQVLSFKRLAYKIFNELTFNKNNITDSGKAMLIYSIIAKLNDKLVLLKNVKSNPGIIDTVMDMISEFKRYNITPEILNNINIKNEYLKIKLSDLYLIYSEYEKEIKEKYIDTDDELTILSKLIDESKYIKNAKIWIDEFSGFTPQEYEIIKKLNNKADVTITLCTDESNDELFLLNNKTLNKLKSMGDFEIEILNQTHRYTNEELEHLEKSMYKYPYQKYERDVENIRILNCENSYFEIENIASEIIKKVRDGNYRYENIAILTRDLDLYKNLFNMIFKTYEIPYFFDDKKELSMQPLIYLILSLFDICINNFSYDNMFNYLKTGLTNVDDINDIDLLENYVLKWGIRGNIWTKEWTIEDNNLEKINIIRNNIVTPILEFKQNLNKNKKAKEIINELYNFLMRIGAYEKMQKNIEELKYESYGVEIANEYIQVWNIFILILDEMNDVIGDEKISFEKFKNIFKIGITKHQIGIIPPSKDQVIIGNIERTRNSNIKILFVVGVNDGVFPTIFSNEGFINDSERNLLMDAGVEIAKDTELLLFEENYNIYKAFTTPSDRLYISYPIANLEGIPLRPSSLINQIKKFFPKIKEENILNIDNITSKNATFIKLLSKLKEKSDGKKVNDIWEEIYNWYNTNSNDRLKRIEKGLKYNNVLEYINKNNAEKLYGKDINLSVSRLEKFSNCPFSFYLKYGLNAKEREIYKLQTPDVGLFLHSIIEKFSEYIIENNIKWQEIEKDWCDKIVQKIVDDILMNFKHNLLNSSNKLKQLTIKLRRIINRVVWIIISHFKNSDFEMIGSEVEFGKDKEKIPVEIELENKRKIILNGKIDRIDIAKTEEGKFIRIIDYKSSDKAINLSDVYYGLQLQLIMYLDVALENDIMPGGVLYLKLDDPIIKSNKNISKEEIEEEITKLLRMKGAILANTRLITAMDKNIISESTNLDLKVKKDGTYSKMPVLKEEDFTALRKHIRILLRQIGNEIANGNIKNEPVKRKGKVPCEYCEFYTICQFDRSLGNKYKYLKDLNDNEVLSKINEM